MFHVSLVTVIVVSAGIVSAGIVMIPGAPLITILVMSHVLNAVLLLPLLLFMDRIARDRDPWARSSRAAAVVYLVTIAFIALCVAACWPSRSSDPTPSSERSAESGRRSLERSPLLLHDRRTTSPGGRTSARA